MPRRLLVVATTVALLAACSPSEPSPAEVVADEAATAAAAQAAATEATDPAVAEDEAAEGNPAEAVAPEGDEAAPAAPTAEELEELEELCNQRVAASDGALSELLERAYAIADEAEGAPATLVDMSRVPLDDSVRAAVFGDLSDSAYLRQVKVAVTPPNGIRVLAFMRQTNTRSRSAGSYPSTVAGQSIEVRIGTSVDLRTNETETTCWFDIDATSPGGGAVQISATYTLVPGAGSGAGVATE